MGASRLSLLDHGPKSEEIRANSRITGNPEVIPEPTPKQPFDRITCGLPTTRELGKTSFK